MNALKIDRKTEAPFRGFAVRLDGEIVGWIRKETHSSPVIARGHRYAVGSTRSTRFVVRDASGRKVGEAKLQARALDTLARVRDAGNAR